MGLILMAIGAFFIFSWGIIHGLMELIQYVNIWAWEPLWYQTMVLTLVYNVLFAGGSND